MPNFGQQFLGVYMAMAIENRPKSDKLSTGSIFANLTLYKNYHNLNAQETNTVGVQKLYCIKSEIKNSKHHTNSIPGYGYNINSICKNDTVLEADIGMSVSAKIFDSMMSRIFLINK